jgi:citrate lyase beta subunit
VLEAFDKALTQGSASTTVDGKMIDVAMANAARRVLNEAATRQKAGGTA